MDTWEKKTWKAEHIGFRGCCDEVPHVRGLKNGNTASGFWRPEAKIKAWAGLVPSEAVRENLLWPLSQLLVSCLHMAFLCVQVLSCPPNPVYKDAVTLDGGPPARPHPNLMMFSQASVSK